MHYFAKKVIKNTTMLLKIAGMEEASSTVAGSERVNEYFISH
jgi:hypothetical protein